LNFEHVGSPDAIPKRPTLNIKSQRKRASIFEPFEGMQTKVTDEYMGARSLVIEDERCSRSLE